MSNYTKEVKSLEIGETLILEGKNYDSVITTNTRLKRNGHGTFSVETVGKKLKIKRVE